MSVPHSLSVYTEVDKHTNKDIFYSFGCQDYVSKSMEIKLYFTASMTNIWHQEIDWSVVAIR